MTEEKNREPAEVEKVPEYATTRTNVLVDSNYAPDPMVPDDTFHWQLLSTTVLVNELRLHFFWTWHRREES